jgi:hypothetical protein
MQASSSIKLYFSASLIALSAASVIAAPALAQSSVIDVCREETVLEARIACLEDAVRAFENLPAPATNIATATPETSERRGWFGRLLGRGDQADHVAPVVAASTSAATAGTAAQNAEGPTVSGIGAEQVLARLNVTRELRDEERVHVPGVIASFKTVPYERAEITLANGQVWLQIRGDTQRIVSRMRSSRDYTVEIWESALGGYRLRINEMQRIIKVERLE